MVAPPYGFTGNIHNSPQQQYTTQSAIAVGLIGYRLGAHQVGNEQVPPLVGISPPLNQGVTDPNSAESKAAFTASAVNAPV